MTDPDDELIGTGEAARLLGLRSLSTVRSWIDRGLLRAYQCPDTHTIRVYRDSVIELRDGHTTGPDPD